MVSIAAIATLNYLNLPVLPNLAKDPMTTRWWIGMWLDVICFSLRQERAIRHHYTDLRFTKPDSEATCKSLQDPL